MGKKCFWYKYLTVKDSWWIFLWKDKRQGLDICTLSCCHIWRFVCTTCNNYKKMGRHSVVGSAGKKSWYKSENLHLRKADIFNNMDALEHQFYMQCLLKIQCIVCADTFYRRTSYQSVSPLHYTKCMQHNLSWLSQWYTNVMVSSHT